MICEHRKTHCSFRYGLEGFRLHRTYFFPILKTHAGCIPRAGLVWAAVKPLRCKCKRTSVTVLIFLRSDYFPRISRCPNSKFCSSLARGTGRDGETSTLSDRYRQSREVSDRDRPGLPLALMARAAPFAKFIITVRVTPLFRASPSLVCSVCFRDERTAVRPRRGNSNFPRCIRTVVVTSIIKRRKVFLLFFSIACKVTDVFKQC